MGPDIHRAAGKLAAVPNTLHYSGSDAAKCVQTNGFIGTGSPATPPIVALPAVYILCCTINSLMFAGRAKALYNNVRLWLAIDTVRKSVVEKRCSGSCIN